MERLAGFSHLMLGAQAPGAQVKPPGLTIYHQRRRVNIG